MSYYAAAKRYGKPNKKKKKRRNNSRRRAVIAVKATDRSRTKIDVPVTSAVKETAEKRRCSLTHAIAAANVVLIGGILAFGTFYMTCLKHEKVAEDENRYLTKFPDFSLSSYLSGDYTAAVADYFDDTVHNRSQIKRFISDKLIPLKGRPYGGDDEVELYGSAYEHSSPAITSPTVTAAVTTTAITTTALQSSVNTSDTPAVTTEITTAAPPAETAVPATTIAPPADNPAAADGELTNNILIVNKRGITLYGGGWGCEKQYASYLNEYKEALPDVNIWSMPLPTACSFYLPDKYKDLAASEKADFDSMAAEYKGVMAVDAYSNLEKHKDEPIYSRTDHHWQPLGAYYAAEEFARTAGVPFTDISQFDKVTLEGYVGTLYSFTQSSKLLNNPEDFVYYIPKQDVTVTQYDTSFRNPKSVPLILDPSWFGTSGYYMVFGMDDRIAHVQTNCKNGRTLVIFKDSYGNALLPFLTGSFENIYLCDIRYFGLNAADFAKQVGATDMLFSMCSYSAVGVNRTNIYNNLHK